MRESWRLSCEGTLLTATVQQLDRFGNIQLSAALADLGELFESGRRVEVARGDDRYFAICALTFADVGRRRAGAFEDSEQRLSIAINRGNAGRADGRRAALDTVLIEFEPVSAERIGRPPLTRRPRVVGWVAQSGLRGAVAPSRRPLICVAVRGGARGRLTPAAR